MNLALFTITLGVHNDKDVIWIQFSKKDAELLAQLRKEIYVRWSASKKCWDS